MLLNEIGLLTLSKSHRRGRIIDTDDCGRCRCELGTDLAGSYRPIPLTVRGSSESLPGVSMFNKVFVTSSKALRLEMAVMPVDVVDAVEGRLVVSWEWQKDGVVIG